MLAEFSIIPLGKDESVSKFVAKAVEIIHQSGFDEGQSGRAQPVRTKNTAAERNGRSAIGKIVLDIGGSDPAAGH